MCDSISCGLLVKTEGEAKTSVIYSIDVATAPLEQCRPCKFACTSEPDRTAKSPLENDRIVKDDSCCCAHEEPAGKRCTGLGPPPLVPGVLVSALPPKAGQRERHRTCFCTCLCATGRRGGARRLRLLWRRTGLHRRITWFLISTPQARSQHQLLGSVRSPESDLPAPGVANGWGTRRDVLHLPHKPCAVRGLAGSWAWLRRADDSEGESSILVY